MPPDLAPDVIRPLRPRATVRRQLRPAFETAVAEGQWPLARPVAVLIAGWLVMVWPWLLGRVTIPWDAPAQFLPQIQFLAHSLWHGESPFWAPYVFSGQNQIADPQGMIFSPPSLLLALLDPDPSAYGMDVMVLLAGLAGAVALLLWCREQGWHWAGSVMAGLTFVFGASMAWRLQHIGQVLSLAYWPMAMLALHVVLARSSTWAAVVLGLIAAAIVLGRDQVAMLVMYLLAAQAVWLLASAPDPWRAARRALPRLAASGVVAILVAGGPVVLTALLAADSNRPVIDLESAGRGSLHPALLITALIPQLFGAAFRMEDYWGPPSFAWPDSGLYIAQNMGQIYIGLLPVLLIAIAALKGQMWSREIRFFVVAFGLIVLYALGWYTPFYRLVYALLPGVTRFRRPADATFVIGALGSVLVGYATHRFFERPWEQIAPRSWALVAGMAVAALSTAVVLAILIGRVGLLPYPLVAAGVTLAASAVALAQAKARMALEPWAAGLILCGVTALDLAWNNGPSSSSALPPATYEVLDPATRNPVIATLKAHVEAGHSATRRDRIELLGLGFHWANASMTHGLENTLGYNPVRSRRYAEATGAGDTIGQPGDRRFTALLPSYTSTLVDLLGLRYVAAGAPLEQIDPQVKPGEWTLIARLPGAHAGNGDGAAWIYENPRARPRVTFAHRAVGVDFDALLKTGQWPAFDPDTTVLLEPGHDVYYSAGGIVGGTASRVAITHYGNTVVEIEADSGTGGYVVLADLWHPWWFASVDERPVTVDRADVLFRAVDVPPGHHRIRFTFRPFAGAWRQIQQIMFAAPVGRGAPS